MDSLMTPIIDKLRLHNTELTVLLQHMKTGDFQSVDLYDRFMASVGHLAQTCLVDGNELALELLRNQESHRASR